MTIEQATICTCDNCGAEKTLRGPDSDPEKPPPGGLRFGVVGYPIGGLGLGLFGHVPAGFVVACSKQCAAQIFAEISLAFQTNQPFKPPHPKTPTT